MAFITVPAEVANFLRNYNGTFEFIVSVRGAFMRYGRLSAGQISGVQKCMDRQKSWSNAPRPSAPVASVVTNPTFPAGSVIEIKAWFARTKGKELNIAPFLRNLRMVETLRETPRAILAKVEFVAEVVESCHVCGKALSTEISRACGIGPVCADRLGISRPTVHNAPQILAEIEEKAREHGVLELWIPRSQVKKHLPKHGLAA
jgi:hypothetical protein